MMFIFTLIGFGCFILFDVNGANIEISTSKGKLIGTKEYNAFAFKGIPYTEYAPIGDMRFTLSAMKTSSYSDNPYNATYYRPRCIQHDGEINTMSEDCLYLNIWTPNIDSIDSDNLLPTVFWIHGGAFQNGAGSMYPGHAFMPDLNDQNVVYVSINYRLNSFGFLALESILSETNGETNGGLNGIHDQIIALKWVNQYIHEFGGDPSHVTIFGESAGSLSVCMLLISPVATGLFDQAILQSGTCSGSLQCNSYDDGLSISQTTLRNANLNDDLDELRQLDAIELLSLKISEEVILPLTYNSLVGSVDGYVLNDTPYNIYNEIIENNGELNANKLIIGILSVDTIFLHYPTAPQNRDQLKCYLKSYIEDEGQVKSIINKYYPKRDFPAWYFKNEHLRTEYEMIWLTLNTDVCFLCQAFMFAMDLLQTDKMVNNIFMYTFDGTEWPYYAPHASELQFLFNLPDHPNFNYQTFGVPYNESLSDLMTQTWQNFAIHGDFEETFDSWTPFTMDQQTTMIFHGDYGYVEEGFLDMYRNNVCDFWLNEIGRDTMKDMCWLRKPIPTHKKCLSNINVREDDGYKYYVLVNNARDLLDEDTDFVWINKLNNVYVQVIAFTEKDGVSKVLQTGVIQENNEPEWSETFTFVDNADDIGVYTKFVFKLYEGDNVLGETQAFLVSTIEKCDEWYSEEMEVYVDDNDNTQGSLFVSISKDCH